MAIITVNPATGKIIKRYKEMTFKAIFHTIENSHQAFLNWKELELSQRAKKLKRLSKLLTHKKNYFSEIITKEMGKPIKLANAEIEKCALLCDYYADHAKDFLKKRVIKTDFKKSYVEYEPLGVILAVMPWNFPFWQVLRFAVPNLIAGNGCILKHSSNVTGSALAIEELFKEAGFPDNLFSSVIIRGSKVKKIIRHTRIAAVTLTGSERVGRIIGKHAGKALKKVVLELGGSDPYLILEDADLDQAVKVCVKSRLDNAGQVCISAKRLIVVDAVREIFTQKVLNEIKNYHMGYPLDVETDIGPMSRLDLRNDLHKQIKKSIRQGAQLVYGGVKPKGAGYFYPPTVLINVKKGMAAYEEELFGPVISIVPAKNEQEAIALANDSMYGLTAAVFTQDLKRGEQIASSKLQAGTCCVNTHAFSDARFPFGGIKASGFGRELSEEGIREFMNIKTIHINK